MSQLFLQPVQKVLYERYDFLSPVLASLWWEVIRPGSGNRPGVGPFIMREQAAQFLQDIITTQEGLIEK